LGEELAGDSMKVYIGIDMAKDKFDYCAMDDTLNILCRGSNKENKNERFRELSDLIRTLKSTSTMMKIGMESTGIYHIPLYNHLRAYGFSVRILNGLEVRGMKKSRVRKTTNDTIDAESIARYLMIREEKETFVVPENLRNLREMITAYSIVTDKIRTSKNNLIRAMDMIFPGLSNAIDIDEDTVEMLSKYVTSEDFISADRAEIEKYVSKRRYDKIMKIASDSPANLSLERSLRMEISSLIRILKVLMDEKESFEKAMKSDPVVENHVIMSIPGIGPITGSVILGKICDITRFENAEKLVAFAGIDPVIKESGKQRSQKSISKRGDSALRSAIYQSTLAAVRGNPVISEFYHRKVDGGMPKRKALVAASRKQCHIIWSVWHNNKPFEIPEKFRKQE
jgi:transposase